MQIRAVVMAILIGLAALSGRSADAQTFSDPNMTASFGAVTNLPDGQGTYAPYAEVEISSSLYRSEEAGISFGAGLYIAGWADGTTRSFGCADCIIYSYTGAVAGMRGSAQLDHFPLPLTFWGGVSQHIIWAEYAFGAGVAGNMGRDHRNAYTALETGLQFRIPLGRGIHLELGGHVHLPVPVSSTYRYVARLAGTSGFSYSL